MITKGAKTAEVHDLAGAVATSVETSSESPVPCRLMGPSSAKEMRCGAVQPYERVCSSGGQVVFSDDVEDEKVSLIRRRLANLLNVGGLLVSPRIFKQANLGVSSVSGKVVSGCAQESRAQARALSDVSVVLSPKKALISIGCAPDEHVPQHHHGCPHHHDALAHSPRHLSLLPPHQHLSTVTTVTSLGSRGRILRFRVLGARINLRLSPSPRAAPDPSKAHLKSSPTWGPAISSASSVMMSTSSIALSASSLRVPSSPLASITTPLLSSLHSSEPLAPSAAKNIKYTRLRISPLLHGPQCITRNAPRASRTHRVPRRGTRGNGRKCVIDDSGTMKWDWRMVGFGRRQLERTCAFIDDELGV